MSLRVYSCWSDSHQGGISCIVDRLSYVVVILLGYTLIEFADDVLIMSSSSVVNEHSGIISLLMFPMKHVPVLYRNVM